MTGNFDRDIETEIFSWNEWNVVPFDSFYSLYTEMLKYSSKRFNFTRFLLPHLFISTQSEQFIRRLSGQAKFVLLHNDDARNLECEKPTHRSASRSVSPHLVIVVPLRPSFFFVCANPDAKSIMKIYE